MDDLLKVVTGEGTLPPEDPKASRREQFAQANASLALEGLQVDAADLEIQERIINGEVSHDEAVAQLLASVRKGAA